jgi:hypothetical protein
MKKSNIASLGIRCPHKTFRERDRERGGLCGIKVAQVRELQLPHHFPMSCALRLYVYLVAIKLHLFHHVRYDTGTNVEMKSVVCDRTKILHSELFR